jgi:hypothetical protein
MEAHSKTVAVRTELDHGRVSLPGRVLGLEHKVFDFAAGVNARFPAAETAGTVAYGEASVAHVQVDANDGLQNILAENTCVANVRHPVAAKGWVESRNMTQVANIASSLGPSI